MMICHDDRDGSITGGWEEGKAMIEKIKENILREKYKI